MHQPFNDECQRTEDDAQPTSDRMSNSNSSAVLQSTLQPPIATFPAAGTFGFEQLRADTSILVRDGIADGFRRFAQPFNTSMPTQALIEAARHRDTSGVVTLLQQDASIVDGKDAATQETAFSAAFANGHRRICELLLEYGASPVGVCITYEGQERRRDSLVRLAVREANLPLLRWLLDSGAAEYTKAIDSGFSAFALAAWHGDMEIVDELLRRGATLEADQCLELPLPQGLRPELWIMDERASDLTSFRLLTIACWRQDNRLRTHLLASHDRLQDRDLMRQYGPLALYCAVYREDEAVVSELLGRGVQADSYICGHASAIFAALQVDSVKMLGLLMTRNTTPVHCDEVLMEAANRGAAACVQELLPTSNLTALQRDRALEDAVRINSIDSARLFLECSVDDVSASSLKKCLRDATENGNVELLELLLSHQGMVPLSFLQKCALLACLMGHADVMALLLAYGIEVNVPSLHGTSCLLHTVVSTVYRHPESVKIAKMLLEHGASVDTTNTFDETPLVALNHKRSQAKTQEAVAQFEALRYVLNAYGAP